MEGLYRIVYDALSPDVGTIDFIELIWTTVALIGLSVSVRSCRDALADLHYVRDFGDEARHIVAVGNVRHEIVRFIVQAELVLFGVMAMTLPRDEPIPLPAKAFLAITISGSLAVLSILERGDRRRLLMVVRRSQPPLSVVPIDRSS